MASIPVAAIPNGELRAFRYVLRDCSVTGTGYEYCALVSSEVREHLDRFRDTLDEAGVVPIPELDLSIRSTDMLATALLIACLGPTDAGPTPDPASVETCTGTRGELDASMLRLAQILEALD